MEQSNLIKRDKYHVLWRLLTLYRDIIIQQKHFKRVDLLLKATQALLCAANGGGSEK